MSCIKRVENSLRTGLGLFCWYRTVSWGHHPAVAAGGRSLAARLPAMFCKKWRCVRGQQLFHPSVLPLHVDRRSSRLLPHYRVREFVGGGLTARRKRKSSLLRPSPLLFLEVGRKKGGITAGQYGSSAYIISRLCEPLENSNGIRHTLRLSALWLTYL